MKSEDKIISVSEAAEILHISSATVLNWVRSGIIKKAGTGIDSKSAHSVLKKIRSGELNKLNKRANKRISSESFLPKELSAGLSVPIELNNILSELKYLDNPIENFSDLKNIISKYPGLKNINTDLIYQSVKSIGNKSKEGSYYTPDHIIAEIINDFNLQKGARVSDPCCGTGRFLTAIAKKYGNDVFLYGNDNDNIALNIAQENLRNCGLNNYHLEYSDGLEYIEFGKYDFIFTNPPWGAHYTKAEKIELNNKYPESGSGDSLEYFILKGLRSLKKDGIMSYILPESFLYVKRFGTLRKFLLENCRIIKIKCLGRVFSNVFSEIIRIDIQKSKADPTHKILTDSSPVDQIQFKEEPDNRFSIGITEEERIKLNSIFKNKHTTLKGKADWSLGIVTGNNRKYVSATKSIEHPIKVLIGRNVHQYKINYEDRYLYHDFTKLQQVAKKIIFTEKEKLIYKFVSNKLVFAYDNTGAYTLNSANIIIPHLAEYPIKVVMAILNSELMNFVYTKRFKSLKVLRSSLEQLPFPERPNKKIIHLIESKTNCIINNEGDIDNNKREIENLVYKLYGVRK